MTESCLYARLEHISPTVKSLDWPADTVMWLERVPLTFLGETERAAGIRLEPFDPKTDFEVWARGRVFAEMGELRWEQQDGLFQVVFCGAARDLPGFTAATDAELNVARLTANDRAYYLWGERVRQEDLPKLGLPDQTVAFVELQIPRILRYPASAAAKRVKVKVREYSAPDGTLVYTRFCGLEEE